MTTLAADSPRTYEVQPFEITALAMVGSDTIYEGAAIGDNGSGYARPFVDGDPFRGFAYRQAANESGSDGDVDVKVVPRGYIVLSVADVDGVDDQEKTVYATDDDTFSITDSGSDVAIGKVARWISGTTCVVYFESEIVQSL